MKNAIIAIIILFGLSACDRKEAPGKHEANDMIAPQEITLTEPPVGNAMVDKAKFPHLWPR